MTATLPYDIARCAGYEPEPGEWREGCEDCLRRTDRPETSRLVWMEPPSIVVIECEYRIDPC